MGIDALGIGAIFDFGSKIVDKIFPDKAAAAEAKIKLMAMVQNGELQEMGLRTQVVVAEAQSEHWLAANWRPITMLSFVFIIVNNYIIAPYMTAFGLTAVPLEIVPDMWALIKIGLGGYVVGRSGEKMIKIWKEK